MKGWSEWEIVRHQVAICGPVVDADERPVAGAQVTIQAMPEEFKSRVERAASETGAEWEEVGERPDRVLSRADGLFYFLDLPNGKYRLIGFDPKSGLQDEKTVTVSYARDGTVKRSIVNLKLSVAGK